VDGVTDAAHFAIELVIQTASGVLTGRYGPKEAVTLLASQGPQARARAMVMAKREPDRAGSYAELLRSMVTELAARKVEGEDARDLRAVVDDVERVLTALTP
jgi:hypothetical protein